ncbi:MAG: OFA family MFS transporter [Candidatus Methanoplasma sp.]|jgi:OFA family oxalate/formate antiporter-like MFS transporter|nr:OFA family MFS transporter [Candidatus Methanoplasma sp.]
MVNMNRILSSENRYMVLVAGIIIQFCAGTIYMWSVYKEPVANFLIWTKEASALTSSVMLAAFVAGILIGGRLVDKIGPRKMCIIGSLLMSFGILLSSLVTSEHPYFIYLTYGMIGGFGVGVVYTSTVSPIQKWFFDRRGFATGMMVGAFGFSLVLFAPLARYLLSTIGVPSTFAAFGIAFLFICVTASFFIKNPSENYVVKKTPSANAQKQYTPKEMLRSRSFYLITLSLFFILPAYFILNPLFMSLGMARGLEEEIALMGVMITGICSATGRLMITWLSDHVGRMTAMLMIFAFTLTGVVLVIFAENLLFVVCLALIAFGFGGAAGIYATVTSDHFGTKNMGSNYGFVMLGFGASALIFPFLSTGITVGGDYTLSFVICAASCIASFVCMLLLRSSYRSRNKADAKV